MKVLIDNGHGENTPGKCSPDLRLREYAYTREIAKMVVDGLRLNGIDADLLVTEQTDISLNERCRRVNAVCNRLGAANVLLISIHCNAAGNNSNWMQARGWECYTSPGHTKSDTLAECIYQAATRYLPGMKLRRDLTDGDSDKEANFAILRGTRCPSVLTENLFQDNKEDVEFMLSAAGKAAITGLHVRGIIDYLNKQA